MYYINWKVYQYEICKILSFNKCKISPELLWTVKNNLKTCSKCFLVSWYFKILDWQDCTKKISLIILYRINQMNIFHGETLLRILKIHKYQSVCIQFKILSNAMFLFLYIHFISGKINKIYSSESQHSRKFYVLQWNLIEYSQYKIKNMPSSYG